MQCQGVGSIRVRLISALAAVSETGRGVSSVIAATCLAQASASALPTIPWRPGTQNRVIYSACKPSMRLRPEVSTEPFWIALRSNRLSVHMATASCDDNSHSSAIHIGVFSSSYHEVIATPHRYFVRRVVGLAGSPPVITIPTYW